MTGWYASDLEVISKLLSFLHSRPEKYKNNTSIDEKEIFVPKLEDY